MKVWTDYPPPGQTGRQPMREVEVIKYDGDKYILLSNGESFKAGYLYRTKRKRRFRTATLERRLPIGWLYEEHTNA